MMEPLRSLEIVWGNGDRLVSGSQTTTDKDEDWDTGVIPMVGGGPAQVDFFRLMSGAQGSMGIATWASVKVEPISDQQKLLFIPAAELGDLIDCAYRLLRVRFGDETFLANAVTLALILAGEPSERARLAAELPRWCLVVGIGGGSILGAEKVAARQADIADIVQAQGLRIAYKLPGCSGSRMLELLQNPASEPYWRENPAAASKDLFFMSPLDRTPGFVAEMQAVVARIADLSQGLGVYIQPVHMGADTHCEFILPYDPTDAGQTDRVEAVFEEGSRALFRAGAYFSRPYGMWAGMVYNADAETAAATRKIKEIFDPNYVMNPGKLCF
jgi:FAD/FMN-containing dehydrogenase